VGLNYHPDGNQHDWQANAIGTFGTCLLVFRVAGPVLVCK